MEPDEDEIVRDDFPTARKGWDPDAVRAHLQRLAERIDSQKVAATVAERVSGIVSAAEEAAAGIETDSREAAEALREDAERTLADARAEAGEIVARSKDEAEASVQRAQETVDRLLEQAQELRGRIDSLGGTLADEILARVADITGNEKREPAVADTAPSAPAAEPAPIERAEPPPDPEPVAATESEPVPIVETEPESEREPETAAEPDPEPAAAEVEEPAGSAETPAPAEAASTPEGLSGEASTDDLIEQLRGGGDGAGHEAGEAATAAVAQSSGPGDSDSGAARLVAMNLALEGSEREEIKTRLAEQFDGLEDLDRLITDVLERAGRS